MRECTDLVAVVNDVDVDVNDAADEDDDGFFQVTEIWKRWEMGKCWKMLSVQNVQERST